VFAGRVGTGFSEKLLASLYNKFQKLRQPTCPFINLPEKTKGRWGLGITPAVMKRCHWVKPVLVAQVKFTEWTHDGQLRQPVFLGLRTDREAKDVVRE
jgi:bifunctional non-homologous end joining protein LigD